LLQTQPSGHNPAEITNPFWSALRSFDTEKALAEQMILSIVKPNSNKMNVSQIYLFRRELSQLLHVLTLKKFPSVRREQFLHSAPNRSR